MGLRPLQRDTSFKSDRHNTSVCQRFISQQLATTAAEESNRRENEPCVDYLTGSSEQEQKRKKCLPSGFPDVEAVKEKRRVVERQES